MMTDNQLIYPYAYDLSSILGGNCNNPRTQAISRITPHHVAGVVKDKAGAENICKMWINRKASANYIIDIDGNVYCAVRNDKRAWTSSNRDNDMKAITFEMSNSKGAYPWPISDKTYQAAVKLSAWCCDTFGITPSYNGSASGASVTTHRMFAATQCPGDFFVTQYLNTGQFVTDIKAKMETRQYDVSDYMLDWPLNWYIQIGAYKIKSNADKQALTLDGYKAYNDGGLYRVRKYVNENNVKDELEKAKAIYPKAFAHQVS